MNLLDIAKFNLEANQAEVQARVDLRVLRSNAMKKEAYSPRHHLEHLLPEIDAQSDRGIVLVFVSILEQQLSRLLSHRLLLFGSNDNYCENLSLNGKIDLLFRIGMVSDRMRKDLHAIREIRNYFAHGIATASFANPEVASRLKTLDSSVLKSVTGDTPRATICLVLTQLVSFFHATDEDLAGIRIEECSLEDIYV